MLKNDEDVSLSDIIDVKFLQEFQDLFAKAMDIGSVAYDNNKQITEASNFTEFCFRHTRGSEEGLARCKNCDITWGKIAAEKAQPVIYECHAGLTDFAVPILVSGQHFGTIFGGQILTETPDENKFRKIARELGINEDEYIEAVRKIKIVPMETVKFAVQILHNYTNGLSKAGLNNLRLLKLNILERLYRKIMESIRSSLDIDETKKQIVNIIGKTTNADRCFITEYDKENDEFFPVVDEYLSSDKIRSCKGTLPSRVFPEMCEIIKKGTYLKIEEGSFKWATKDKVFSSSHEMIAEYGVKSGLTFPLYYFGNLMGTISLHYVKSNHIAGDDEIALFKTIADQISIALYQARTYKMIKLQAERETFNRKIVEILRSTLEKNTLRHLFVNTIGQYFKADRVFFVEYCNKSDSFFPLDKDSEYLSSSQEVSFAHQERWDSCPIRKVIEPKLRYGDVLIPNMHEYIIQNKLSSKFADACFDANIKSSYILPVLYQREFLGYFCIEFTKEIRMLSQEDIDSLRLICVQAGIGLYQAKLYSQAQESAKMKSEFIANMSHELKTPLNLIIGFSDVLSESDVDRDKQLEYLSNIKESGKHLFNLTTNILNISKIESEKTTLNYENVDIESLITRVVKSLKVLAGNKNITILIESEKIMVKVDKTMIMQVLQNLLVNAIKFTATNGTIVISTELSEKDIVVSVCDNGVGIAPEHQDLIFEPFNQIDELRKKTYQGTGLGLTITKKIIELHNGSINVKSQKGQGSCFYFSLPLDRAKIEEMKSLGHSSS